MSRVRGVMPIFVASAIGVINGIWIFDPSFKELQQEKKSQGLNAQEVTSKVEDGELKRDAEASASRLASTEAALKPISLSSTWWPKSSLWPKTPDPTNASKTAESQQIQVEKDIEGRK